MKELSVEEKAKRYDEAIKVAADIKAGTATYITDGTLVIDAIFPELTESEGGRIRKALIEHFKWNVQQILNDFDNKEVLDWLEKQGEIIKEWSEMKMNNIQTELQEMVDLKQKTEQGEQKPIDKVKPKFKVGDFIVNDYCMGRVVELTNDAYLLDTGQGIPFSCEHNVHLWTIQDAKDGDVLSYRDGKWIFIYKGIVTEDTFKYYALLSEKGITVNDAAFSFLTSCITPATKDQCDLLFSKMKEVGYEWNAENKQLRKIEKKLAEDSCKKSDDITTEEKDMTEYKKGFECGKQRVLKYPEDFGLCKKIAWSEDRSKELSLSLQIQAYLNTASDELYAKGKPLYSEKRLEDIHKCMLMWQKLHNAYFYQNPAWSEEDNRILSTLTKYLEEHGGGIDGWECSFLSKWLKSLKDRVQPQSKQEWSKEDKKMSRFIGNAITADDASAYLKDKGIEVIDAHVWLYELKERVQPQNTWKPSVKQIHYLSWIANIKLGDSVVEQEVSKHLNELLEDLKKLKG